VRPDRIGLEHHAEIASFRRQVDAFLIGKYHRAMDVDVADGRFLQAGDAAQGVVLPHPLGPSSTDMALDRMCA